MKDIVCTIRGDIIKSGLVETLNSLQHVNVDQQKKNRLISW